jgi:hypothetical protein
MQLPYHSITKSSNIIRINIQPLNESNTIKKKIIQQTNQGIEITNYVQKFSAATRLAPGRSQQIDSRGSQQDRPAQY